MRSHRQLRGRDSGSLDRITLGVIRSTYLAAAAGTATVVIITGLSALPSIGMTAAAGIGAVTTIVTTAMTATAAIAGSRRQYRPGRERLSRGREQTAISSTKA